MVSVKSRLRRRGDIQQRDLDDGCVLYDREKEMTYALNITASLFWSFLDGKLSLEQVAEEIACIGSIQTGEALEDLCNIVALFQENGLLEHESL